MRKVPPNRTLLLSRASTAARDGDCCGIARTMRTSKWTSWLYKWGALLKRQARPRERFRSKGGGRGMKTGPSGREISGRDGRKSSLGVDWDSGGEV